MGRIIYKACDVSHNYLWVTIGIRNARQQTRLPAIDLSAIEKARGGEVDGILGVDLLEQNDRSSTQCRTHRHCATELV